MKPSRSSTCMALALVVSFPTTAWAAQKVSTAMLPQPNSPIALTACFAYLNDTDVGNINYYLDVATSFVNRSSKTAAAVRVRFDVLDAFYAPLRQLRLTYNSASYSPGEGHMVNVDPTVKQDTIVPGLPDPPGFSAYVDHYNSIPHYAEDGNFINTTDTAAGIICSIDTVEFADGTVWQAPRPRANLTVIGHFINSLPETYTVLH
jgi:hypothetical protein